MPALLLTVLLMLPAARALEAQDDTRLRFDRRDVPTPSQPYNLSLGGRHHIPVGGDFDADGDQDVLITSSGTGEAFVLENDGAGSLSLESVIVLPDAPWAAAAGDFDRDGDLDLALVAYSGHSVTLFENDGVGQFSSALTVGVGQQPHQIVAADFDGDGALDLATANDAEASVTVLMNR